MNTKLKAVGTSPIYQSMDGRVFDALLQANPDYQGNVHDLTLDGKNYLFEIKNCRVVKDKWIIMGWLSNQETSGKIVFEQQ
ncbi:MAG: hypothetical protein FMNOHCHN_03150 [Ignavibacteriaceae bacterium]|nr:hypothetical protein [Ignavibacteriaceae bacterium]